MHEIGNEFLDAFAKLRKATTSSSRLSVCPSVRPPAPQPAWNKSASTGWMFMRFDI